VNIAATVCSERRWRVLLFCVFVICIEHSLTSWWDWRLQKTSPQCVTLDTACVDSLSAKVTNQLRDFWYICWHNIPRFLTLSTGAVVKYCDEYVRVCLCVCLSVCPRGYLRKRAQVMYLRLYGWHHVFFYNGQYSRMNFATLDRFFLNLLICRKGKVWYLRLPSVFLPVSDLGQ